MVDWSGYAVAVLIAELTPGPNMTWLAALAMMHGRRAGLAATAGILVGLALNGAIAAAGLATLVAASPTLWNMLRWAGAVLMLWLAWESWRDATTPSKDIPDAVRSLARHFWAGFSINLLNPKAFLFYVVVVPQFIDAGRVAWTTAAQLVAISITIATIIHLAIVSGAGRAHGWMADPVRTRTVRRIMAVALVGVAIWFIVGTRR